MVQDISASQLQRSDLALTGVTAADPPASVRIAPAGAAVRAPEAGGVATPQAGGGVNHEVVFKTDYGSFYVELFNDTPIATQNFLNYTIAGHWANAKNTFIHRLVPGFVMQAGSFWVDAADQINQYVNLTPITGEPGVHANTLGTIATALSNNNVNSATDSFFFNLADNSQPLTSYTVFGQIIGGISTPGFANILNLSNYDFSDTLGPSFANVPLEHGVTKDNATVHDLLYFTVAVAAEAVADVAAATRSATTTINLGTNDYAPSGESIAKINGQTFAVGVAISLPSGAKLTVNANGTVTYDPNHVFDAVASTGDNYFGKDSFTYTLADGNTYANTATATIAITQTPPTGDKLTGTAGTDTLTGHATNDILDGGAGADALHGLGGNDLYFVDQPGDLVYEFPNDGIDTVVTTSNYYLYPYVEYLTLASGAGNIFGVGNAQDNGITGNEGANTLLGGDGNDTVHGGAGIDILYGEAGADQLFGDAGNDFLAGGVGDDVMDGGAGGDSLYGEDGNDTLTGGSDFVFDQLVGGAGNDILHGDSGLGDYDYLYGNAGNDSFYVDTPNDLVFEQPGEGTDIVFANINGAGYYLYDNIENLTLLGTTPFGVGNALANTLIGNAIGNYLLGGDGNDTLNGMGGNDVLFGQGGADKFVFGANSGADVIGDFTPGTDRIDLSAFAAFGSFAALQAHMVQNGGNTAIDLGNGNLVVLNSVTMAQLHVGDFILPGGSGATEPFPEAEDQPAQALVMPIMPDLHVLL